MTIDTLVRRARVVVAVTLIAVLAGVVVLAVHPKTGPEVRGYLRDRYLRPCARLPEL